MTGRQRIEEVLAGSTTNTPPVMPIVHTALARCLDVPMDRFFSDAGTMADVIVEGGRRFGFDGVQLTLGVIAEPEALGALIDWPPGGAPLLKQHLLADLELLNDLRNKDVAAGGRLPLYQAAVQNVVKRIGEDTFVLSTLRGPLNIASQLRGVEDMLVDMLQQPEQADRVLAFATDVSIQVARASLASGAHGIVFGEATCSPNFISPSMYRRQVHPWHVRLIHAVREMGWRFIGLHVCGNIVPILDDLINTDVTFLDVDYQVPATRAIAMARGRVTLRGNLNPVSLFLQGKPVQIEEECAILRPAVRKTRWIMSTGCDMPPGTPAENIAAFVKACRQES